MHITVLDDDFNHILRITLPFFILGFLLVTESILIRLYIYNPYYHEWLHHIGLCLDNTPNVQTPFATYPLTLYLILPDWIIAISGIPFTTSTSINQLVIIPLNISELGVNFPYIVSNLVLFTIPSILGIISGIGYMKTGSVIFINLMFVTIALFICSLIISLFTVSYYNIIEWINNAVNFSLIPIS